MSVSLLAFRLKAEATDSKRLRRRQLPIAKAEAESTDLERPCKAGTRADLMDYWRSNTAFRSGVMSVMLSTFAVMTRRSAPSTLHVWTSFAWVFENSCLRACLSHFNFTLTGEQATKIVDGLVVDRVGVLAAGYR